MLANFDNKLGQKLNPKEVAADRELAMNESHAARAGCDSWGFVPSNCREMRTRLRCQRRMGQGGASAGPRVL